MARSIIVNPGDRFGFLSVVQEVDPFVKRYENGRKDIRRRAEFECDCGNRKIIALHNVVKGSTLSCGCHKKINSHNRSQSKIKVGDRVGRWTVIKDLGFQKSSNGKGLHTLECLCVCGTVRPVLASSLKNQSSQSCGCLKIEKLIESTTKHGRYKKSSSSKRLKSEYGIWKGMKARCANPENNVFKHYGGRGITVCDGWSKSFESFVRDMGDRPSPKHSIERIDTSKNYQCGHCPECISNGWEPNCKWATQKEQMRNTRVNRLLTIREETKTMAEWAEFSGVNYWTLSDRLRNGWNEEDAVFTPASKTHRGYSKKNKNT